MKYKTHELKMRKYKFPVLGQVRDVEGAQWDVREVRSTKYGFDLLFGSPVIGAVSNLTGLPRLIATGPLAEFWESHRIKHTGVLFDLPAGRTTLKRVRQRLGFHYHYDVSEFWQERMADLQALSVREFAARHNVPAYFVDEWRLKLLGRTAQEPGWWQAPWILEVLRSKLTLREMGEKLGISITHAKRLRDRAREWEGSLPMAA